MLPVYGTLTVDIEKAPRFIKSHHTAIACFFVCIVLCREVIEYRNLNEKYPLTNTQQCQRVYIPFAAAAASAAAGVAAASVLGRFHTLTWHASMADFLERIYFPRNFGRQTSLLCPQQRRGPWRIDSRF